MKNSLLHITVRTIEIDASPAVSPKFKKGYTIISIILLAAFTVLLIYIKLFP